MTRWQSIKQRFATLIGLLLITPHAHIAVAQAISPVIDPHLQIMACPNHIDIAIIGADAEQYASVTLQTNDGQTLNIPLTQSSYDGGTVIDTYQLSTNLGFDSGGTVTATYDDGTMIHSNFSTNSCDLPHPKMSSLRGSVFIDQNRNSLRDINEVTTFSWFKISDGGSWFVCGYAGNDGTFGVPLKTGWYDVIPVAPQGWRATTPRLRVFVESQGHPALNVHLGLVQDNAAPLESCDQYHPAR